MSIKRIWRLFEQVGYILILPAIICHEMTHYVAACPVAEELEADLYSGRPAVYVNWDHGKPYWRIKLAKVAPTIVGIPIGVVFAVDIYLGNLGLNVASLYVLGLWVVYTLPSMGDLADPVFENPSATGIDVYD